LWRSSRFSPVWKPFLTILVVGLTILVVGICWYVVSLLARQLEALW
jgi:hypothetical protein